MHNGQMGGFENFRKRADMGIPDKLYDQRKGATDSEALFLRAIGFGLATNPLNSMQRAVAELQSMSEQFGRAPHMRMSAAFSDGQRLYALRYASDDRAPSLYYRRDEPNQGWAVASEPLDADEAGWLELPAGTMAVFERTTVKKHEFAVKLAA